MAGNIGKNWDSTKWILLISILLIVEGFIFYASMVNANSLSALGYVSFAGTITSIILAVLAIIYGFVQNGSQERKSGVISEQMGRVKEVVEALQKSKSSLGGDLEKLENIANKIEVLSDHSLKTKEELKDLNENFNAMKNGALSKIVEELSKTDATLSEDGGAATDSYNFSNMRIAIDIAHIIKRASESDKYNEDFLKQIFDELMKKRFQSTELELEDGFIEGFSVACWEIVVGLLHNSGVIEEDHENLVIKNSQFLNNRKTEDNLLDSIIDEHLSKS